ncbi:uncharacterized protein [Hetaerina americana]|uniref:uncharacterized protein n=1 Tax=Hetaerina americana TaxID=62018 RepID=UPI003A7F3DC8
MSDVKGTLPVAEQNYNQSTKKRICRIPKSLSTTPTAEHCKSSLTKTRGGSCRQKRPLSGGESDQQKSCGSDKRKIRRSPRKKIQELRPFPKKRHLPTDNVGESFQPDNIEEEELPKGDAFDSVTAVDVGMDPSKSPKRKALDGYKPDFLKKPTETILKMTSQKEKMNDSLLAGVVQENLLEEMEAPPLSPLSDDVLVDSLIIFPDSSSESPSEEDIKSVDIDTAQELSIKHDLKKVITAEKPREINELPITKDISTTLGVAMEESMDVADVNDREAYMKVVDHQGDKDAAPKQSQSCPPDSGKVSPSTLISVLEGISNDWRNSKDYFNKMLKQVQLENAGKEKSKNVPCRLSANLRKILKAQLGRLNGKHFGNSILNGIIAVISDDSNGFKSKNVAKYLIRMLSKEDEDDVQPAMLPGAPRMTCLQMRVLSLVLALENRCPNFSDLSEVMLDGISFILFRLGHCPDVEVVKTLARMYTVFCMAKNDIMRARCFCFDALFSIATKAVELITVVICMWHEVLPVQDSSRVPSYIESSVFMAISHVTATKNPVVQKNISALKRIVYNMYKAEFHKITFEQFLDKLMLHLSGGGNLQGLEPAAVLMAKRQGWEWTHKNLLCGRLVSLMENWKQNRPFTSSAVTAVNLIGLTSRSCPIETSGPVKNIIETLSRTLIKEPCDDPSIKEALVVALIRLSKYHMYHIVRALDIWRPMREPPEEVKNAIRGLILRPSCQKFFRVKYRSWKTPVVNRCKKGGYFERSKLLDSNEISAGGNEGEDEDYFEGIEEEKAGGEVESGKCWLPNKDRLKYKVWVKEEKNEEWVNSEVKKWDGTAFKRSNRRKRRKLNNARASEG